MWLTKMTVVTCTLNDLPVTMSYTNFLKINSLCLFHIFRQYARALGLEYKGLSRVRLSQKLVEWVRVITTRWSYESTRGVWYLERPLK